MPQLQDQYVPTARSVCPNCKVSMPQLQGQYAPIAWLVCLNWKISMFQQQGQYVPNARSATTARSVCRNCKVSMPQLQGEFAPIAWSVCPNCKVYAPTARSYNIQHCFICRPSDSTVPTDAGIEIRTVATGALAVRRSNH